MRVKDVKQLLAQTTTPLSEPEYGSSSECSSEAEASDSGQEPSILWAHNANLGAEDEGDDPEIEDLDNESLSPIAQEDESELPVINELTSSTSQKDIDEDSKITLTMKELLKLINGKKNVVGSKPKKFRVPNVHAIFNGEPTELETFITHVQLAHHEYTTGKAADEDNPGFIYKLVDYFKANSSVRIWFEAYAVGRREKNLKVSWSKLVKALREDYGIRDQEEEMIKKFFSVVQGTKSIQAYISELKSAALLAKSNITPSLLRIHFMDGLRNDIQAHVRLKAPKTVEQAQEYAMAYEENLRLSRRVKPKMAEPETHRLHAYVPENSIKMKRTGEKSRSYKKPLSIEQNKALIVLREMRKGKCFLCGSTGHLKGNCSASAMDRQKHHEKISELRKRINTE
jgi:hypothetical protein